MKRKDMLSPRRENNRGETKNMVGEITVSYFKPYLRGSNT